jgi:peptide/nickel transport system permease protein
MTTLPRLIALRLLGALPTLLGLVILVFMLIHAVPGDPLDALLGEHASPTDRAALAASLGLNLPLGTQLLNYFSNLMHGNLGVSLVSGAPVLALITERLPATGLLALGSMLLAVGVGVPAGVAVALLRGRVQAWGQGLLVALVAVPSFCLGPLLIMLFAVQLGWLPVSGMAGPSSIILPSLTLGLGLAAALARMVQASLSEQLGAAYLHTLRAKGGSFARGITHHALRNAWLPVVVVFCLQLGMVLTGAVLTEAVFGWPGLGNLLVEALHSRDYAVLQGCLLLIGLVYILANLLADSLTLLLDPRAR